MVQGRKKGRRWRCKCRKAADNVNTRRGDASDPSFIQLRQWMIGAGFRGCQLQPAHFQDTGRGLMATQAINSGDVIVSIPKALLITTDTVLESYLGPLIKKQSPPLSAVQILSVFLILERHRGKSSLWYPYVSVLPQCYTNAAYWEESDIKLLPKALQEQALDQISNVKKSFKGLQKFKDKVEDRWESLRGVLTLSAYRWAWSTVNTRSVYMKHALSVHVSPNADHNHALAPLLDLLNHTADAQITASFNATTQCYEIQTETPYKKYNQVFINYGPHDNHKLMLEYGFILPSNPHNVLLIMLDDIKEMAMRHGVGEVKERVDILMSNDLHSGLCCSVDGLSWKLLTALRIMCMGAHSLSEWKLLLMGQSMSSVNDNLLRHIVRDLLTDVVSSLDKLKDPVERTPHTGMLLALRDEQLNLAKSNLTRLDQEQLQPG